MIPNESVATFRCDDDDLLGILHRGTGTLPLFVFVVGGPQYRVGSHRMFVELARELTSLGADVFRFDCSGMGDSDGEFTSFEDISDDIRSAIDCALNLTGRHDLVLLGLCDGASACAMYATTDSRVSAMVLLNPWVRTEQGEARTRMQYYYAKRFLQREFWRRMLSGGIELRSSLGSFIQQVVSIFRPAAQKTPFIEAMQHGIMQFSGPMLTVLSEDDLTAQEFVVLSQSSEPWKTISLKNSYTTIRLSQTDHTFSGQGQVQTLAAHISQSDVCRKLDSE